MGAEPVADAGLTRSVQRACDVLVALAEGSAEMGVTQVARATGFGKSTVFRLLQSLISRGLVAYSRETQAYRLGARAFELGLIVQARLPIRREALPFLQALRDLTGETATLYVPVYPQVMPIIQVLSQEGVRAVPALGAPFPLHFGAIGKVVMAAQNEAVREALLDEYFDLLAGLPEEDPSREILARSPGFARPPYSAELATVRRQGYALSLGQIAGLNALAFPLANAHGLLLGGISIVGPAGRWTASAIERAVEPCRTIVDDLELRLRYMEPLPLPLRAVIEE